MSWKTSEEESTVSWILQEMVSRIDLKEALSAGEDSEWSDRSEMRICEMGTDEEDVTTEERDWNEPGKRNERDETDELGLPGKRKNGKARE